MKIGIATDHNGIKEKQELIEYIKSLGFDVLDLSPHNTPTDDYPDFASLVCINYIRKEIDLGIIMCMTGIGMSITANKYPGIRCAKVSNVEEAHLTKEHNDANILALSYKEDMNNLKAIVKEFLLTPFSHDERHIRRINKIKEIEDSYHA